MNKLSSMVGVCLLSLVACLAAARAAPASGPGCLAPQKGFVLVLTKYFDGTPAPNIRFYVKKLQGNYPVPKENFVTNVVGQYWAALYPGVYRIGVRVRGAVPSYYDVTVTSGMEDARLFLLPGGPAAD